MLINDEIIVFEPSNILTLKEFVKKYAMAYSCENNNIEGIFYKQTNIRSEEQILKSEVDNYENFKEKMSWKLGCKKENPNSFGRPLDLKSFFINLNVSELTDICNYEDKKTILEEIIKRKVNGIGPVYAIATLFFISKGRYPIYDRFANTALNYLFEKADYPKKGESKAFYLGKSWDGYDHFIGKMEELLKRLGKEGANYIEYRDLDRALWVYGHGFMTDNISS